MALLSGLLLTLSFPKFGHPVFAWIALTPLLVSVASPAVWARESSLRAWMLGLVTGFAYFAGTIYWTADVLAVYGELSRIVSILLAALLVAYLALFPAAFALIVARVAVASGTAVACLTAPAVWVASEWMRGVLLSGFPWVLLGYSQTDVLSIAQLASVTGVYGLSGLAAASSAALAWVVCSRKRHAWAALGLVGVVVLFVALWGRARIASNEWTAKGQRLMVGIVQGNVPQDQKWDRAHAVEIFDRYLRMSRQAVRDGATLVVWPESSTPFMLEEDPVGRRLIAEVASEGGADMLIGSSEVVRGDGTTPRYYNAAFMVSPRAVNETPVYRKMHLVPFGEYVPFRQLLFFARPLVEGVGDFTPGEAVTLLPIRRGRVSTAICYEIIFPPLVREAVVRGSELLTTITNDAWYGDSSAPYQHFEQARLRSIEQGRYLVRAANTGISGIVDPYGRVVTRTPLFQPRVAVGEVRLITDRTLYSRIGDLFAYACLLLTALVVVISVKPRAAYGD
ncbi:MAG: apolipoprotein N-acyltransferase [Luteitalea sp.]|nr:apolipoprotein N-acyltransferase [Luteitalea sp.]